MDTYSRHHTKYASRHRHVARLPASANSKPAAHDTYMHTYIHTYITYIHTFSKRTHFSSHRHTYIHTFSKRTHFSSHRHTYIHTFSKRTHFLQAYMVCLTGIPSQLGRKKKTKRTYSIRERRCSLQTHSASSGHCKP
jgi:hypothetical protein